MERRLSRSVAHGLLPLTGALALLGCESMVALGGDCEPFGNTCGESSQPVHPRPPDASNDAHTPEPSPHDGGGGADEGGWKSDTGAPWEPDAGTDAGEPTRALFPSLDNPSFELQNGTSAGDLGASLSTTDISPWYHCQVPGASFLRVEEAVGDVLPAEGGAFMGFQYPYFADLPVPVFQTLAEPLRAGQTYAFMVDVRSEGAGADEMLALGVRGGSVRCSAVEMLANTEYLPVGAWESRCVRFTPRQDMTQLSLLPVVKGVIALTFKLYVDNIREDPSCQ
jgi:hypothetical protein